MSSFRSFSNIILCIALSSICNGQKIAIESFGRNIAFKRLPLYLNIVAEKYDNKKLLVSTNNGRVKRENQYYTFIPDTTGASIIYIHVKQKGTFKKIGERYFSVRDIPEPKLVIGTGKSKVSVNEIKAQEFARIDDSDPACWDLCNYRIDSFQVVIIHNKSITLEHFNIGSKLDAIVKQGFQSLSPNDIIIFRNIVAKAGDGNSYHAKDVIINLVDATGR